MWRGPSERTAGPRNRGFTLLEMLVSAALFSLVITGIYMLYTTMLSTMSRGELKSDLQQNARVGLDQMTRELRMAGYDPQVAIPKVALQPKTAIRAASGGCLSFVTYSLDRSTSPATEKSTQITYDLSETTLRRQEDPWDGTSVFSSGGGAQPLAESMNSLAFTYYDANNNVLTPYSFTSTQRCPPTAGAAALAIVQLDYSQLRLIRRVAITLAARDSRPGVLSEFYTLTSDVRLRNK